VSSAAEEREYGHSARHYEFVAGQLPEYYRMYMQSWAVLVSAILVGSVIGLGGGAVGPRDGLGAYILCMFRFVMAGWFLLTSWFWARFSMLRHYLAELESTMEHPRPRLYSQYEAAWFGPRAHVALALSLFFAAAVYVLLAVPASTALSGIAPVGFHLALAIYGACALLAVVVAGGFVRGPKAAARAA
jgi:hypothetical protein